MKKQKIMLLLEITLLIMIVGTIVSYAAGSNPPSDGVKYNSTTVKAALDDLYSKVGSAGCSSWATRTPDTSVIAAGSSRTYFSGIYPSAFTVSCASQTCPTCANQGYIRKYTLEKIEVKRENMNASSSPGSSYSGCVVPTFKHGAVTLFTSHSDCTTYFNIDLGTTIKNVESINLSLYGNYSSSNANRADWDFKVWENSTGLVNVIKIHEYGNHEVYTNSDSVNKYALGEIYAEIVGERKLRIVFATRNYGNERANLMYKTKADKFYVSGNILYRD